MKTIEIQTRRGTADGLTDAERLQLGALLLKAGYCVELTKRRQDGGKGRAYDQYITISGGFLGRGEQ